MNKAQELSHDHPDTGEEWPEMPAHDADHIIKAMIKFGAEITNPPLDGVNPHYNSRFTTLAALIDHVRPVLAEHGLGYIFLHKPGHAGIQLFHESGEAFEPSWLALEPDKPGPQALKSASTYARRMLLEAVTGVAGETDDDAESATQGAQSTEPYTLGPAVPDAKSATGKATDPGAYTFGGGRHELKSITEVWKIDPEYVTWLAGNKTKFPEGKAAREFIRSVKT